MVKKTEKPPTTPAMGTQKSDINLIAVTEESQPHLFRTEKDEYDT